MGRMCEVGVADGAEEEPRGEGRVVGGIGKPEEGEGPRVVEGASHAGKEGQGTQEEGVLCPKAGHDLSRGR